MPVGQTFKNFEFPFYEDGKLKWTATATQATGITQNRAETLDIKIKIYDNDTVTTTITSPQADIYVTERKMRSTNTVLIERADMEATAQTCDFDMGNKKYVLRTNVKVTLKNFDAGASSVPAAAAPCLRPGAPTARRLPARRLRADDAPPHRINSDSLPESPGTAYFRYQLRPDRPDQHRQSK